MTFKVADMQRFIGKIVRLGEGAHWIYKIMAHMYFSLAFALKQNVKLLKELSQEFRDLSCHITTKQFKGKPLMLAKQVCFAMKKAAQMANHANYPYRVSKTMREGLNFIRQALDHASGIKFCTPFVFLIPRMRFAIMFGDSSLEACGGYSIPLRFWWHLQFPDSVKLRTLLYKKNNKDKTLISINALKFFTVIIN